MPQFLYILELALDMLFDDRVLSEEAHVLCRVEFIGSDLDLLLRAVELRLGTESVARMLHLREALWSR